MRHWKLHNVYLGEISVTILSYEIVVIIRRKAYLRIYSISRPKLRKHLFAVCACIIGISITSIFHFGSHFGSKEVNQTAVKGEDITNIIAKSEFKEPEKKVPLRILYHTVKPGETLSEIARMYGISMDTICGSNKLDSYDLIHVGQVLRIPNKDGIVVTMQKGQTLHAIAKRYNAPLDKILTENNFANPDFVNVGQLVFIPDAKPLNIFKGFIWPVASKFISSGYGWRRDPFYGDIQFHRGIDIKVNYEWVKASKYGRVSFAGWLGGYGKVIIITHPSGEKTVYGHLSKIVVREGQYVKQGQIIAKSGNTGNSTGPHLHFEIIKDGHHINPLMELRKKR